VAGRIGDIGMTVADANGSRTAGTELWYARSPDEVATQFGVDPATGLSAARAAELLTAVGPNALPEEKPKPGWLRFLEEYRSYMQIILVAAAVVSLLIKEWTTAVLLLVPTVLNAVIGLRQQGKAESAAGAVGTRQAHRQETRLHAGVMPAGGEAQT
jgi:P-type Ca2+ transporter type 2C